MHYRSGIVVYYTNLSRIAFQLQFVGFRNDASVEPWQILDRSLTGPLQHYHGAQWDEIEPMKAPINKVTNQWSCIVVRRAGLRICCGGIGKTKGHKTDNPTSRIWNFQNHITDMQETGKDWSFEDVSNLKRRFTLSHRWKRVSYERNVSISFMHQLNLADLVNHSGSWLFTSCNIFKSPLVSCLQAAELIKAYLQC